MGEAGLKNFKSLADLVTHFAGLHHAVQREAEKALEKAAKLIEKTAKEELGYYQPGIGPFPAWQQLAQSTLAAHALYGVGDTPLVLHGGLYNSIEHEVRGPTAIIGTKLDIGAYQEFGTSRIPPRPFMGPAALRNAEKIKKLFGEALVSGVMGGNALLGATLSTD